MEDRRNNDRDNIHNSENERVHETHNLHRLNELSDFKVAEHDPDIRGWDVRSLDGSEIGKVKDLVVDKEARKVRYIDVHLKNEIYKSDKVDGDQDMHLLVPIGAAALHENKDDVRLDMIETPGVLQNEFPVCEGPLITQDYERKLRDFYTTRNQSGEASKIKPSPTDEPIRTFDKNNDKSFYNQDYFDQNRLYRNRR